MKNTLGRFHFCSLMISIVSLFGIIFSTIICTVFPSLASGINGYLEPDRYTQVSLSKPFDKMPLTFCAQIQLPEGKAKGVIFGNYNIISPCINYSINKNSNPEVLFIDGSYKKHTFTFKKVKLRQGSIIHLAIVTDLEKDKIMCYINGKLKETQPFTINEYECVHPFIIGCDDFYANTNTFNGKINSISVYSKACSRQEIIADQEKQINTKSKHLLTHYDFSSKNKLYSDSSIYKNSLIIDNIWAEDVEDVETYDYSMAVVGDTQILSAYHPEKMAALYDWIVANKESQKIELVMGLGDITEYSADYEWAYAKQQIYKLNDVVPYTIIPGNHDHYENGVFATEHNDFSVAFDDGVYTNQLTGRMSNDNLNNTYKAITIGSHKYLIMCLDFIVTQEIIDWASSIITSYPDHKVIITTHSYMFNDNTTIDSKDLYPPTKYDKNAFNGDMLWDALVKKHSNILMVLSGHDPCDTVVYRQDRGDNNNLVTQMLVDPQRLDFHLKGFGMVAMLYFSNDGETMTVRYYSTDRDTYVSDLAQFTIDLY